MRSAFPVRPYARRCTGLPASLLVEFQTNRGFFVAPFSLDAVVRRLEVRSVLEPGIARLAAERGRPPTSRLSSDIVENEERARARARRPRHEPRVPHPACAHAPATRSSCGRSRRSGPVDIGRQLLRRSAAPSPTWQSEDALEHRAITEAVEAGDGDMAAELMAQHLAATYAYWSKASKEALSA